jgi:hypothetical protein
MKRNKRSNSFFFGEEMRSGGRVDKFFLTPPVIGNVFHDAFFLNVLRRHELLQKHKALESELEKLGERCSSAGDIAKLGDEAEANPPKFVPYGPWGNRVDRIEVSQAWKILQGEKRAKRRLFFFFFKKKKMFQTLAQRKDLCRLGELHKNVLFRVRNTLQI